MTANDPDTKKLLPRLTALMSARAPRPEGDAVRHQERPTTHAAGPSSTPVARRKGARRATPIPRPERVRSPSTGFGWADHRLLRDGLLAELKPEALALYLFLVIAADRNGVSFYRIETIAKHLGYLDWPTIHHARAELIAADLIAFQPFAACDPNGYIQVLSLVDRSAPHGGSR